MTDAVLNEILEELEVVDPDCTRCGRPTVTTIQWRNADTEERRELRDEGKVPPGVNGLCDTCYRSEWRKGRVGDSAQTQRRDRTLNAYKACLARGMTSINEIADEIGITSKGLRNAVDRAKRKGDLP